MVNFVAFAVYTRLLTANEYGRYSSVMAGVALVSVMAFQWLQLVFIRFLSEHKCSQQELKQYILGLFLLVSGIVMFSGVVMAMLWLHPVWRPYIMLSIPIIIVQAWFQLNLLMTSVQLNTGRYARLIGAMSVLSLLIGSVLAMAGYGAYALLNGMIFSAAVSWLVFGLSEWRGVRPSWPPKQLLREYLAYGMPLMITCGLTWVISSSDRMLISLIMGEKATGVYAVGYDLSKQSLGLILSVVNTAAYPLVLKEVGKKCDVAAKVQLAQNGELIMTFALSGASFFIALSPAIAGLFIGSEFKYGALAVMPWIAGVACIEGINSYYLEMAYHLSMKSRYQVYSVFIGAVANIILNLLLIPRYGVIGAAWATLAAVFLVALTSTFIGKKIYVMPSMMPLIFRASIVAIFVYVIIMMVVKSVHGQIATLITGATAGVLIAVIMSYMMDIAGLRGLLVNRMQGVPWRSYLKKKMLNRNKEAVGSGD